MTYVTDEELTGFLDAELAPARQAEIEAMLEADTVLAARIEALDVPLGRLRDGMAAMLQDAPHMPDLAGPSPARLGWAMPAAAALVAGVVLGAGLMMAVAQGPEPRGWQDYAAAYHVLYQTETLSGIAAQSDFTAVSDTIGLDLGALAAVSDVPFLRAQILGFGDQPIIQMAYLDETGTPHALCIMRTDGPARAVTSAQIEGLQAASWSTGTHEFLLLGGANTQGLAEVAEGLAAAMRG